MHLHKCTHIHTYTIQIYTQNNNNNKTKSVQKSKCLKKAREKKKYTKYGSESLKQQGNDMGVNPVQPCPECPGLLFADAKSCINISKAKWSKNMKSE